MSRFDSNAAGLTNNLDTEVGKFVVDAGLATREEVDHCREQQKQSSDPNQRSLADLLVENSFITVNQAKRIRRSIDSRKQTQIPGYELLHLLGKGAMAKVYKARQLSLDRIVAIKVLPKHRSNDTDFVERFYKEGRAAARLSHPNIVQAIDVGSTPDGYHFFVMEYIEGATLYDLMVPPPNGAGKQFSEQEAIDIGIHMCDALMHAHRRGLIHRDVKPKNILLTPQNIAKLTDLGLAREVDDLRAAESEAGKAYGTPYYISPEQIRGELEIDARADIYSLGATLYHLVTGRVPFEGETPSAVMHRHLKETLLPPDHLNSNLSAGISEVIEQSMQKDKNDRYASIQEMMDDLKSVRDGAPPVHARHHINLDTLNQLEERGVESARTVDIESAGKGGIWDHPAVVTILIIGAVSLLVNIALMLVMILS
jgi:eukaryotic-like serine/threonine-protein kinase